MNDDERWRQSHNVKQPTRSVDSRVRQVLDELDAVTPEFRHLVAASDNEYAELVQSTLPHEQVTEIPTARALTPAERTQMDGAVLGGEILGTEILESADPNPFGSHPTTNAELEEQLNATARALEKAYERGDQDAVGLVQRYGGPQARVGRTTDFMHLLVAAAEKCDLVSPEVRTFVKAYATGDRAAMRAAVRPLVHEILVAELGNIAETQNSGAS